MATNIIVKNSVPVFSWNQDGTIEKMDSCKRYSQVTSFNDYTPGSKKISQLVTKLVVMIYPHCSCCSERTEQTSKNAWLLLPFYDTKRVLQQMDSYNWCGKLTQYLWKNGWFVLVSKRRTTLEKPDRCKGPSEIMTVLLKMYGCKISFK